MDTNQRTANNYQINSFIKGMNSDTSYDMVGSDQYLFGQNIRITNNTLLFGDIDSNNTEHIIAPVVDGVYVLGDKFAIKDVLKILATASIGTIGAIIVQGSEGNWSVYVIEFVSKEHISTKRIFTSSRLVEEGVDKFSTVIIKETEDVIKLYVADGVNPVMQFFIKNGDADTQEYYSNISNERYLSNSSYFPSKKPILSKDRGFLKTQQVQYAYRFYKKYGSTSKLSPLTNKIHIIGDNRHTEIGNAEDTVTNIGMKIKVVVPEEASNIFDYCQIFRISYIKHGEKPNIYLVCDKKIPVGAQDIQFVDNGNTELQTYTIDEFSALFQQVLIPHVIESNQGYLFQASVKDDTVMNDVSGINCYASIAQTDIRLSDVDLYDNVLKKDQIPHIETLHTDHTGQIQSPAAHITIGEYLQNCGVDYEGHINYNEMFTSSLLRSLRYDEKYDYGIVFYDKYGRKSYVQQILTPDTNTAGVRPFSNMHTASPIGMQFTINGNWSAKNIVGFEIVRRDKSYAHSKNLFQVALSRPSRQGKYRSDSYRTPYYPNVLLTTQFMYYASTFRQQLDIHTDPNLSNITRVDELWSDVDESGVANRPDIDGESVMRKRVNFDKGATNVENFTLYQAFCPEINIYRNDVQSSLSGEKTWISPFSYYYTYGEHVADTMIYPKKFTMNATVQQNGHYPTSLSILDNVSDGTGVGYTSRLENSGGSDVHEIKYGFYLFNKHLLSPGTCADMAIIPNAIGEGGMKDHLDNMEFVNPSEKVDRSTVFTLFGNMRLDGVENVNILASADVKNPEWGDGFSSVQLDSGNKMRVAQAVKQYKSYSTPIHGDTYVNWCACGMYNLAASKNEAATQPGNEEGGSDYVYQLPKNDSQTGDRTFQNSYGWIGPGPVCLLLKTEKPPTGTSLCTHQPVQSAVNTFSLRSTPASYAIATTVVWELLNVTGETEDKDPVADYVIREVDEEVIGVFKNNALPQVDQQTLEGLFTEVQYADLIDNLSETESKIIAFSVATSDRPDVFVQFTPQESQTEPDTPQEPDQPIVQQTWVLYYVTGETEDKDPVADYIVRNVSSSVMKLFIEDYIYQLTTQQIADMFGEGEQYYELMNNLSSTESKIIAFSYAAEGRPDVFVQFVPSGSQTPPRPGAGNTQTPHHEHGTIVANIQHSPAPYDTRDPYYGFGNYFELPQSTGIDSQYVAYVFDGDVYQNYSEFTNLFKTYDFNDRKYTIQSGQVVYYIPTESKINVMFDYGMNYRNTESPNLMLEPGQIEGVASQSRPLHQYNRIYSDNDWSISTHFLKQESEIDIVNYPQRIAYSQFKTNGEKIDNWQIFKPADFIDADTNFGDVTELKSKDSNVYFWQNSAFGKLSVNERSLVTDDNGEQIVLGKGGVLQNVDYISTKYGMQKHTFCDTLTENSIFWIDIENRAVVMYDSNNVVNYGELLNVQNIINKYINTSVTPTIHYDIQHNELLCNFLQLPGFDSMCQQLVFNTKLNVAQSVYTRSYSDIISFENVLIGLEIDDELQLLCNKYNYIKAGETGGDKFLSPTVLEFVVNSSPSQTKVFDNQKVVVLKKDRTNNGSLNLMPDYLPGEHSEFIDGYFEGKEYSFETDVCRTEDGTKPEKLTDREGNICYSIPRSTDVVQNGYYGGRLRGKWMVERITDSNPQKDYCISHIITKFRQSYS